MPPTTSRPLIVALAALLTACGGGSAEGETNPLPLCTTPLPPPSGCQLRSVCYFPSANAAAGFLSLGLVCRALTWDNLCDGAPCKIPLDSPPTSD